MDPPLRLARRRYRPDHLFRRSPGVPVPIIQDFEAGDGGDVVDIVSLISRSWDYSTNPFSGLVELIENGNDVWLRLQGHAERVLDFASQTLSSFTAFNMDGFALDGTPLAGQNFTGDGGGNALTGTRGGDTIDGLGGNDILRGGWGNDTLNGGDQDDDLDGEEGSDIVNGGAGNDVIADLVQGSDTLNGGGGNDMIIVRRDHAVTTTSSLLALDGGAGDDVISIEFPLDSLLTIEGTVMGGDGNDTITIAAMRQGTIDGGAGNDLIRVYELAVQVTGPAPPPGIINAGPGDDRVELLSPRQRHPGHGLARRRPRRPALARGPNGTIGLGNVVTDFQAGAGGDRIELLGFGAYQFVQQGPHTLLRDSFGITHLVLRFVDAATLVPENFGKLILGTPGNDVLQAGGPGRDRMEGGAGNNLNYVDTPNDIVNELLDQGTEFGLRLCQPPADGRLARSRSSRQRAMARPPRST